VSAATWRSVLLAASVLLSMAGWAWMVVRAAPVLRGSLALLSVAFGLGIATVAWRRRHTLRGNQITAMLALSAVIHTALAAAVVAGDRLGELGLAPALLDNGHHFVIGVAGLGGAALAWVRARGSTGRADDAPPEAPPSPPATDDPPLPPAIDGDPLRAWAAHALRHVAAASTPDEARARAEEHIQAMALEAEAEQRAADADDALSQAAALLEWGAQKLPELAELDVSDLLMAKAIADIRAQHDRVERVFVDHRELLPIHPIDRATADEKADRRAEAARAALPLLEAHDLRLSEALIAAHDELAPFRSVTGLQVVRVDDGYVTFEGNGRREALLRALPDRPVQVEVRWYRFADEATARTIARRVDRVRRHKGLIDR